uniref:Uncharacterized protein n=1 Tax=Panthera tigris altaica TaxID=74533 RepID=A0A8C9J7Y0_PANTA
MAEELAQCHPFRGNATVSCDSSSGYMLRGPCMRARQCGKAAPTMSPSSDPGTRLLGVWGSSTPKRHKADFNHFLPLNLILPQWSQHSGRFHTQQDKGRRLRHDTVPFQAEAGILDSLKNQKETRKTNNKHSNKQKKLTTTKIVCPFAHLLVCLLFNFVYN